MSDTIKHECGFALIRLRKPLSFYYEKYGTAFYGIDLLYLLLQKQRNRGQDGAGLATIKLNPKPGKRYISRERNISHNYLDDLFKEVYYRFKNLKKEQLKDPVWLKENMPFIGELLLGHLRYGTHGKNTIETCHPFLRQNNWITRNLVLAGNFNMTNVDELFDNLVELGQYPKQKSDTVTVLEKIGHFLDMEVERLFSWHKPDHFSIEDLNEKIIKEIDVNRILTKSSKKFDGGYVMAGMIGHGDAFVMRDPSGIRPCYYYFDDEIIVAASERPAIQTALGVDFNTVLELPPGNALIIKRDNEISLERFIEARLPKTSCSFERIYFSRGTDKEIYKERKRLGFQLTEQVLEAIDYDVEHAVFSFVPNTAESSFLGLVKGVSSYLDTYKKKEILKNKDNLTPEFMEKIFRKCIRIEKIIIKDAKLRTFIIDDANRNTAVKHAYDITYGIIENNVDTIILIDDSIVRGTTLQTSIINSISNLHPKKIIIVSSAPQIRYPDCYGIDMSIIGNFIAFKALIELLKEKKLEKEITKTYKKCKLEIEKSPEKVKNMVIDLYNLVSYQEVTDKISELVTPKGMKIPVQVIYPTVKQLNEAIPEHSGDWYFSGNYPTPGGMVVVNKAFINFYEKKDKRAY